MIDEREPTDQDYEWAASVKGEIPEIEPDEPFDLLGDEAAMREDAEWARQGQYRGEPEQSDPPVRSLDVMRLQADISNLETQARMARSQIEGVTHLGFIPRWTAEAERLESEIADLRARLLVP